MTSALESILMNTLLCISFWSQWYGQIVSALIGAVILLWAWNMLKKLFKK